GRNAKERRRPQRKRRLDRPGQRGRRHEIREGNRLRAPVGRARGRTRKRGRAGNGPAVKEDTMRRILWILAAAGVCLLAAAALLGNPQGGKSADEKAMKAAEDSARAWLALMDSGQYARSWKESARFFQKQVTQEEWEKGAKAGRESLGKVIS